MEFSSYLLSVISNHTVIKEQSQNISSPLKIVETCFMAQHGVDLLNLYIL